MKMFLAIVMISCIIGCYGQVNDVPDNNRIIESISYFKDYRTNLCFASVCSRTYGGSEVVSITNVPCKNVENFIK